MPQLRWKVLKCTTVRLCTTAACDVYSYGLVMWEMLTNRVPFAEMTEFSIIHRVAGPGRCCPPPYPPIGRFRYIASRAER